MEEPIRQQPVHLPRYLQLLASMELLEEYAERLVHYFVANDIIAEEKRHAILLTAVIVESVYILHAFFSPVLFGNTSSSMLAARMDHDRSRTLSRARTWALIG